MCPLIRMALYCSISHPGSDFAHKEKEVNGYTVSYTIPVVLVTLVNMIKQARYALYTTTLA